MILHFKVVAHFKYAQVMNQLDGTIAQHTRLPVQILSNFGHLILAF